MHNLENIDKEIEELEKQMFGTPPEEEPIEQPEVKPEPIKEPTDPPEEQWEKRFKNYKASTDLTIRDLRSELASYKTKVANLQEELSVLKKQSREKEVTPTFSEEDIDILGEPAVNVLNKSINEIVEKKVKPLEEELDKSRKELIRRETNEARELAKVNYEKFLTSLIKLVPNVEEINISKGFLEFMEGVDESSGYPRKYLFKRAEDTLDVKRVASFFDEYLSLTTPVKTLEDEVMPLGTGGEVKQKDNKDNTVMTRSFIDKFYSDYNRGKYKGKEGRAEAARIEAMIDRAVLEGRII